MTKEEFARMLNGREYGDEISSGEETLAKLHGLVVAFGYSDDNCEFRGAINDEVGCYDGGKFLVTQGGVIDSDHECDCDHCGFKNIKKNAAVIEALWCEEGDYSWTYRTKIPHATFEIVEDVQPYCRGIVFNISDIPAV